MPALRGPYLKKVALWFLMTTYGVTSPRPNHVPKPAVDAFVNIFIEELQIAHVGYQLVVRKTK
jgi:hypothetical protein